MESITLLSPAKINLTLEILRKRDDGYHEISSIMQPISIFDRVKIEVDEGDETHVESKGFKIPQDQTNLAVKSLNLFLSEKKIKKRVKIFVNKKIPIGGGLGGGSSNAAAVLVGLNRMLKIYSDDDLLKLSPKLGADVSFFMKPSTSLVEGIGEKITPLLNFPSFYYVVIYPKIRIETKNVYTKWDELNPLHSISQPEYKTEELIKKFLSIESTMPLINDLEQAVLELCPQLKIIKELLISLGCNSVLVSGSGSCIFAVFRDEKSAEGIFNYVNSNADFSSFIARGIQGWHRLTD